MTALRFGAFLPPHHWPHEDPTLLFDRDLAFTEHLDRLGVEEIWVGEHHSTGWETISSPEMFLSAAAMRTNRIMLGTGVVSLPYHNPFHVADRIVLLDHLSHGRAMLGTGPGAVPIDQEMLGLDPALLRDQHAEMIDVVLRLLRGEIVTAKGQYYELNKARLQLLPRQANMPVVVSSSVTPSGMRLAGKLGTGVLSISSTSESGIQALTTQWGFAEESAAQHGNTIDRSNWRVVLSWHIAESREQAEAEVAEGMLRWQNEYAADLIQRPGDLRYDNVGDLLDKLRGSTSNRVGTAVIGTPDDLIEALTNLQELCGGFGVALGMAHDWASPQATQKSWDLVARYVAPAMNGRTRSLQASEKHVTERMPLLMDSLSSAIRATIMKDEGAVKALEETARQEDRPAFIPTEKV